MPLLAHATWAEVEAYLATCRAILIPIGSIEQHGPNGLIGTDAICAEGIARGVGEATNALVGPTCWVGMAQHHLGFPGSMTLRPSTLIQVVRDWTQSLARHGFERFIWVNGHGGNMAPMQAAFSELYAEASLAGGVEGTRLRCKLVNWFLLPGVGRLQRDLYGADEGQHATPSEVALTQFLLPDSIKRVAIDRPPALSDAFFDAADFRRRFPDGRMGSRPEMATPEAGERFYRQAVDEIAAIWRGLAQAGDW